MMVQSTDPQEDNGIMSLPALTGYKLLCGACKLFHISLGSESDIGHAGWYWVILHHSVITRLTLGRLAKCLENHQLLYLHCGHEQFPNSLLYFSENTVGFVLTFLLFYQILQTSNFWPTAVALWTESLSFWRLRKNSPPSSQCVLSLPIFLKTLDKEEWRFSLSSKSLARCLVHHSLRPKCCVSG